MKRRVAALEIPCRVARRLRDRRSDGIDMELPITYPYMYLVHIWMKYMQKQMENQVDVVVVGAGPVGLLTAIELTLGGVRVLVLERLAAPSLVLKAGGIGPLGIEALQRRGMAAAIAAAEARTFAIMTQYPGQNELRRGPRISGHFA